MLISSVISVNYQSISLKNNSILYRPNEQDKNQPLPHAFSSENLFYNQQTAKEQALQRAMAPTFSNLAKDEEGNITFDSKQLSEEEVLALRESDLKNVGINWGGLQFQLDGQRASMASADQIVYNMDFFAAEYVQYVEQINMRFEGQERLDQLQKLDDMFYSSVEKYANDFAEMAGNFFAENGVAFEKDQFKGTITEFFEQRKDAYTTFIQENENYAGVKGTDDEWLLSDAQYMGEQLRYAFAEAQPEVDFTSSNGMKLDDLVAIGTIMNETKSIASGAWGADSNNKKSEEEFGVELGLAAMKYTLITSSYNLSDDFKASLDNAFENFLQDQNERASKYVKSMQNDPFVRDKESYAVDWDKQLVESIIHKMVQNLQAPNINQSFKNDITILLELYKSKASYGETSELSRYHQNHNSWEESYYVDDWNKFIDGLSLQTGTDLKNYVLDDKISSFNITI